MANFIVGLTGGIGSGKSTVAKCFEKLGVTIVDADQVARDLVAPNTPALAKISEYFGKQVIQADGTLDRARLREIIFTDENHKHWLNSLLHPAIREEMLSRCHAALGDYCILEVPLLVENKLVNLVDRVLVVDVDEELQISRTLARDDSNLSTIKNILKAQATRTERLAVADDTINNDDNLAELDQQVHSLHQIYLNVAKDTSR